MSLQVPKYKQKASRFEYCCVRFLYLIPFAIIGGITAWIYMMIIGIFNFINFFTVLFAGKRFQNFYDYFAKFLEWGAKAQLYFAGATDERPPLIPF